MAYITIAAEGVLDVAVARKIIEEAGHQAATEHIKGGKTQLDRQIPAYGYAARISPWLVLRDLDHDAPCPGELVRRLAPTKPPELLLRIPVRSVETWLLADRRALAQFLAVRIADIPNDPESLPRPKRTIVDIAARSRRRSIRDDLAPDPSLSTEIGPRYSSRLAEFVRDRWDPHRASASSPSLVRCLNALQAIPP